MAVQRYVLSKIQPPSNPAPHSACLKHQGFVHVSHSGCDMELFRIPCFPHQPPPAHIDPILDTPDLIFGAYLGLILDACEIISNNKPGFLGTSKDKSSRIPSNNRELLLSPGEYYYHLIDTSIPNYPIVTEFDAWTPPSELPRHWQDVEIGASNDSTSDLAQPAGTTWSIISQMVKKADTYCAMTGESSRLNTCHLVPKASAHWFMEHRVYRYFKERFPNIDDPGNLITLRTDLNGLGIDQGHFVFVPIQGKLTIYFITNDLPDLAHKFHCHCISLPIRISPQCLYYRFAWSIFKAIVTHLVPAFSTEVICVPVPGGISERRKRKAERKGAIKGKDTTAVNDSSGQPSKSEDVEMQDVDNASLLSQSDDELEHPLDLSAMYNPEIIPMLAAEDARIKEQVGPTLNESNIHLLSNRDRRYEWYPGFSDILCLKQRYLRENPQVRAVNEAATGRINDGYESDSWGWGDREDESEDEDQLRRIVSEEVDTFA